MASWTTPITASIGDVYTAAWYNQQTRDNLTYLYDRGVIVELKIIDDATILTTGTGKLYFCIPAQLNGFNLVDADAFCTVYSSSGLPTIMIRNATGPGNMLSTAITLDVNEFTSYTAATQPVISTGNAQVSTGALIGVDVSAAGTGVKGLGVILVFR